MKNIKALRLLREKSQFDLSLDTKIPNYRLSLLETGKAEPRPDELERLAKALDTLPEILTRDFSEELILQTCSSAVQGQLHNEVRGRDDENQ